MKTKANKLAIVPATSALGKLPSTQPPPRKADIICALVERARVKHQEEAASINQRREDANKAIEEAICAELEKNPKAFQKRAMFTGYAIEVEYSLRTIPVHITKLVKVKNDIPILRPFDAAKVKRDITAKMAGGIAGDRVKALLSNPEAVKKLDETLEALSA